MNTYTWTVESMKCHTQLNGQFNVVFGVSWRAKVTDGTVTEEIYGEQTIPFEQKDTFTSFDKLTEQEVIGWVQTALGTDKVTELQEILDSKLASASKPVVVTPSLPWVTSATPN
jgi:hypothetical protein